MKKLVSFLLVFVLLLSLCSCGDDTLGPGDTATVEDVEVKFIGVETVTDPAIAPAEGKVFILCEFEVTNHTGKDLGISTMLNFKVHCDGNACNISLGALMSKGAKSQLDGTIGPNRKLQGVVGYEVPAHWKELEIDYTPSIVDDAKLTFVAKNNG